MIDEDQELPLCACGCGEHVSKKRNKWIHGHNPTGIQKWMIGKSGKNHPRWVDRPIRKCKQCGKEFESCRNTMFCSKGCSVNWMTENLRGKNNPRWSEDTMVICKYCDKEFYTNNSNDTRRFCSRKCYIEWLKENTLGENNPCYGIPLSEEHKQKLSASHQGIAYEEWENYACRHDYCPLFDENCRESNREKYDRRCFICNKLESENMTKNGQQKKLCVHHYDMDKLQGCDGRRWKLVPVCMNCHPFIHTGVWETRITWLIENVWRRS